MKHAAMIISEVGQYGDVGFGDEELAFDDRRKRIELAADELHGWVWEQLLQIYEDTGVSLDLKHMPAIQWMVAAGMMAQFEYDERSNAEQAAADARIDVFKAEKNIECLKDNAERLRDIAKRLRLRANTNKKMDDLIAMLKKEGAAK